MAKKFLKAVTFLSLISILLLCASLGVGARATASSKSYNDLKLYVGGMPFGVKFLTDGVIVSGFTEESGQNPARDAGLSLNDVILSVNGTKIISAEGLNEILAKSGATPLTVEYRRDGKTAKTTISPKSSGGGYSLGIYVRDSGAGIGTVTFICPQNNSFGGLGHGICDADGRIIPMQRGSVVDVRINGVVKGLSGAPGEVKGYFTSGKTGTLLGNTDCGVYGIFAKLPIDAGAKPVSLGLRGSVKNGKAYIYNQLDGETVEKYEIEIGQIDRSSKTNKCFSIKVTDKRLIEKTGGIVQGMSGSPIIQDGRLIGAVTHVLVNDPTAGYGIFIENMLNQMGDLVS